jgi:hypothetical protein
MDLQGPFDMSIKGFRYSLVVIDDKSHMGWKKFLKLKSEASGEIQVLITELKNYTGRKVEIIRLGRGEFADDKLWDWFKARALDSRFQHQTHNNRTALLNVSTEQLTNRGYPCLKKLE